MKKIYAWTMVEMVVALTVLILLSGMCVSIYKPNIQKARIIVYATMRNLTQGNLSIMEKNDSAIVDTNLGSGSDIKDYYCINLADAFSLQVAPDCKIETEVTKNAKVNITFPTGVTVQGLVNEWKTPYDGADFQIKNIVIDIDGSSGANKVGIDRFPLRVYSGSGYTGLIQLVDCKNDYIYNTDDNKVTGDKIENPYCKQGFVPGSTASNVAFSTDNKVVSYDIYRATSSEEESTAEIVASSLSPLEADCGAYGGEGLYNYKVCKDKSFKLKTKCATSTNCSVCTDRSNCPRNAANTADTDAGTCATMASTTNPDDLPCFTLLHKPSGGTTFLLETLIGQFDM